MLQFGFAVGGCEDPAVLVAHVHVHLRYVVHLETSCWLIVGDDKPARVRDEVASHLRERVLLHQKSYDA